MIETTDGYIALGSRPDSLNAGMYRSLDGITWTPDPTYGGSVAPGKLIYAIAEFNGSIIGVGVGRGGAIAEPVLVNPPNLTPPPSDAGLIDPENWSLMLVDSGGRGNVELVAEELRSEPHVLDVMIVPSTWDSWYAVTGTDTNCLVHFGCSEGVVVLFSDQADVAALAGLYAERFGFSSRVRD